MAVIYFTASVTKADFSFYLIITINFCIFGTVFLCFSTGPTVFSAVLSVLFAYMMHLTFKEKLAVTGIAFSNQCMVFNLSGYCRRRFIKAFCDISY